MREWFKGLLFTCLCALSMAIAFTIIYILA